MGNPSSGFRRRRRTSTSPDSTTVRMTSFCRPAKSLRPSASHAVVSAHCFQRSAAGGLAFAGFGTMPQPTTWSTMVVRALSAKALFRTRSRATWRSVAIAGPATALASPAGFRQPCVRRPEAAPS
jgi:hypothetical protein